MSTRTRRAYPKRLRDEMQFGPGDALELESEVTGSLCGPVRPKVTLKEECGVSVYQGEPTVMRIPDLIDREREKRLGELIG